MYINVFGEKLENRTGRIGKRHKALKIVLELKRKVKGITGRLKGLAFLTNGLDRGWFLRG